MDFASLLSLCLASGPGVSPERLWSAWSFAPQTALPLAATLVLYVHAARMRGPTGRLPIPVWRVACFVAGWSALALALVSPLCRLSATLVSAHMVQHLLIVAVAPPLLLLCAPFAAMRGRSRPGLFLAMTFLYGAAIWLWHFPPLYAAVLLDSTLHTIAYAGLIAVSLAFWSMVLQGMVADGRLQAASMLFATLLHTGVLGALLTFAGRPLYPLMGRGAGLWGLSPLADQQLAGLLMWVPMSVVYLAAALAPLALYLFRAELTRTSRTERPSGVPVTL